MKVFAAAAGLACMLMPVSSAISQTPTTGEQASAPAPVAVQQVMVGDPGEQMVLVIWHPTPSPQAIPGAAAEVSGEGLPLVIVSHGTGAGPLAHVDTAQALASAGFVVAAPMHRGDNFQDDSKVGRPDWMASRSRDVAQAIDYMVQQWPGRTHLDGNRVGIFGFSAGATAALIAAGGVPELDRVGPHCAAQRELVCDIMVPATGSPDAQPPRWVHDSRIGAIVIAAPGLGFAFEPAGLAGVQVPVQMWVGSADDIVPYASNGAVVRRLLPQPADFHSIDGAGHLSFLAPCTAETPPQFCSERNGFDRSVFHERLNRSVSDFFRQHLGGSPAPANAGTR